MGNSLPGLPQAEGGTCQDRGQGKSLDEAGASQDRGREPEVRWGAIGIRPIKGQTRRESGVQGWETSPTRR